MFAVEQTVLRAQPRGGVHEEREDEWAWDRNKKSVHVQCSGRGGSMTVRCAENKDCIVLGAVGDRGIRKGKKGWVVRVDDTKDRKMFVGVGQVAPSRPHPPTLTLTSRWPRP